jgi:hypothetical protein
VLGDAELEKLREAKENAQITQLGLYRFPPPLRRQVKATLGLVGVPIESSFNADVIRPH